MIDVVVRVGEGCHISHCDGDTTVVAVPEGFLHHPNHQSRQGGCRNPTTQINLFHGEIGFIEPCGCIGGGGGFFVVVVARILSHDDNPISFDGDEKGLVQHSGKRSEDVQPDHQYEGCGIHMVQCVLCVR